MTALANDTNLLDPSLIPSLGGPPHELFDMWRSGEPVHWNPPSDTYQSPMPGASVHKRLWVLTKHKDVFDITRTNASRHLSFGTGPHVCLGARLARYQLQALLYELLTRLPDIRPIGEQEMLKSIWCNAVIHMPVKFTRAL